MTCIMESEIRIGQARQSFRCRKGSLHRLESENQITRFFTLAEFFHFTSKPTSHIKLSFPSASAFVRDGSDAVLFKVHVANFQSIDFAPSKTCVKGADEKRFQVLALSYASGQQLFALFLGGDPFSGLLFSEVDERVAVIERIAREPFLLNRNCEETAKQREFAVDR